MKSRIVENKEVLLDDEDFEKIKDLSLSIVRYRDKEVPTIKINNTSVYLHRFLLDLTEADRIMFHDRNKFNVQKENLYLWKSKGIKVWAKKWYEENKILLNEKAREKYNTDPEYKKRINGNQKKYVNSKKGKKARSNWRKLDHVKDHYNTYYRIKSTELKVRFRCAKDRAKRKSMQFTLTFEEYCSIISKPCFYSGESMEKDQGSGLDRIDNSKGYHLDNVLPSRGWCNRLRGALLSVDETKAACMAIKAYRDLNNLPPITYRMYQKVERMYQKVERSETSGGDMTGLVKAPERKK